MKKILTSIIIAILLVNIGIYAFADENTQENVSAELKMSEEIKDVDGSKEVIVKLAFGELQGIDDKNLIAFKGIFTYSTEYFEKITQDNFVAASGYNATYEESNQRLVVYADRKSKSNEDIVEVTFKLKEGVTNAKTSIEFKTEEFTDSVNDFELKTLRTNLSISSIVNDDVTVPTNPTTNTTNPTTSTTNPTENTTKPTTSSGTTTNTTQTTTTNTTSTASTTNTTNKGELEILTTSTTTGSTQSSTNSTQDTTKTEEKELPKTGLQTVAIILMVVTAVGTLSYFKYKNIEIK